MFPEKKILKAGSSKCKICDTHTDKYTSVYAYIYKHTHKVPYGNTPTKEMHMSIKMFEQVI